MEYKEQNKYLATLFAVPWLIEWNDCSTEYKVASHKN